MKRAWRWPLAGFVLGGLVGATLLTVNIVGTGRAGAPPSASPTFGEILHTPPLLASRGEPLTLTFGVVCGMTKDEPGGVCSPSGSLYVRGVGEGDFSRLALGPAPDGELSAAVPAALTRGDGFDYYVEVDNGRGETATLPEGAANAPQHVWVVDGSANVDLEGPVAGAARPPDGIVARAAWGKGAGELGLDSGREQARIGPSAFDIAPDGSVVVLDQVNHRLAYFKGGRPSHRVQIDFAGGEGDLVVGRGGTVYVLDDAGSSSEPIVRALDPAGSLLAGAALAEPTADMLRVGPDGPVVHAYPSEQWFPTGSGRTALSPSRQVVLGRPDRATSAERSVVVHATPSQARFALVDGERVEQSWLVRGSSQLGEVQLAEPFGTGLLVVLRLWNEARAQFRVLQLTPAGLRSSFAVDRAEWAESASLSRFRLHGNTLYQLRSAPSGTTIAAFEIGGKTR